MERFLCARSEREEKRYKRKTTVPDVKNPTICGKILHQRKTIDRIKTNDIYIHTQDHDAGILP